MALVSPCRFIIDMGNQLYINEKGTRIILSTADWRPENINYFYMPLTFCNQKFARA